MSGDRIVRVETFSYDLGLPKRPELPWNPVLVRLTTAQGLVGLGEAGLAYGIGHRAAAAMISDLARKLVLGRDPQQHERIWDDLYRKGFWGLGGGPVVFGAISALDIALWDIRARRAGLPVFGLLGGRTNPALRCYASQIQFGWHAGGEIEFLSAPEAYGAAALQAVAEGYDCVKVDPVMIGDDGARLWDQRGLMTPALRRRAGDRLGAIRDAVGPDVDIILELHSLLSVTGAIQLAEIARDHGVLFIEEPVGYNNDRLHNAVAARVDQPLAGGERVYTRWGFVPYFEARSLDVVQPDFCLVGGISEGKKVCDMAHAYDITVQGHVCGGPVTAMAAAQVETAIPNFEIHEHHINARSPDNRAICLEDPQPEGGRLAVSDAPGLGLTLDDAFAAKRAQVEVLTA